METLSTHIPTLIGQQPPAGAQPLDEEALFREQVRHGTYVPSWEIREQKAVGQTRLPSRAESNWGERAECKGDLETSFCTPDDAEDKEKRKYEAAAKVICERCPVITNCLEWALINDEDAVGVWGGKSQKERRDMLKGRR